MLSGETGVIPVRVRRREALDTAVLTGAAASTGTGPLEFSEKAGWLCAKSEYPGSKNLIQTAETGLRKMK